MNPSGDLFLGIDLGGTKTAVVVGDAAGRVHARVQFPTGAPDETRRRVTKAALGFNLDFTRIGIACGGPLDSVNNCLLDPPNLPGWEGAPLVRWFEEDLARPACLLNDANAGALAEWRWGAGRGAADLVFLTCGTGLGAGIVAGGRLLAGAGGNAGEIGHVRLTDGGPVGYGKPGSVEGWASGGGIARQATADGWPADITTRGLAAAAAAGDPRAAEAFATAGTRLGQAIAILVDLLNPQIVILGSLYVRAQALLEPALRRALEAEALPSSLATCRVVPAELGEAIGDLQALAAALWTPGAERVR